VERSIRVAQEAVEQGINFMDTANTYNNHVSEECIGKAIKGRRSEVLIGTKVGMPMGEGPNQRGASRHHILVEVEASLRALETDYIDLYQIHAPDPQTPVEETMRTLDDLVSQGKVRYIGCSNYAAWQVCEAMWASRMHHLVPMVSVQPHYNMLNREVERELVPLCGAYNIGILPFFPLAGGFLTGKYRQGQPPPAGARLAAGSAMASRWLTEANFDLLERLEGFAARRDHTVGELAIAWLLANPQVSSVIAGATSPEQVKANVRAGDWRLTKEEMAEVGKLLL
jgi:aryl-alcohol dehydrogenase-like predicted oxidoreductase